MHDSIGRACTEARNGSPDDSAVSTISRCQSDSGKINQKWLLSKVGISRCPCACTEALLKAWYNNEHIWKLFKKPGHRENIYHAPQLCITAVLSFLLSNCRELEYSGSMSNIFNLNIHTNSNMGAPSVEIRMLHATAGGFISNKTARINVTCQQLNGTKATNEEGNNKTVAKTASQNMPYHRWGSNLSVGNHYRNEALR